MPWPPSSLTAVRELSGRGRGLVAASNIPAGAPVLCEVALASTSLSGLETHDPWAIAALLAAALLSSDGVHEQTTLLEPRTADGLNADPAQAAAIIEMRRLAHNAEVRVADLSDAQDLECLRLLHVVQRNALELLGRQALCVRASMCNHSCQPNATHQGFQRADGALCCCIRAVRAIAAGEEVCISYIADLACSATDRARALEHHSIQPDTRACDAALEAWAASAPPPSEPKRVQLEREIGARNAAADKAWEQAIAINSSGDAAGAAAAADATKQRYMQAAAHYAQLMQVATSMLGESHAILLQARQRLAQVMMMSDAQRSQANALPLWRAVLAVTRSCVPPHWPALLEPLRGAAAAAAAAGEAEAAAAYATEVDAVLAVLQPRCADVS